MTVVPASSNVMTDERVSVDQSGATGEQTVLTAVMN